MSSKIANVIAPSGERVSSETNASSGANLTQLVAAPANAGAAAEAAAAAAQAAANNVVAAAAGEPRGVKRQRDHELRDYLGYADFLAEREEKMDKMTELRERICRKQIEILDVEEVLRRSNGYARMVPERKLVRLGCELGKLRDELETLI